MTEVPLLALMLFLVEARLTQMDDHPAAISPIQCQGDLTRHLPTDSPDSDWLVALDSFRISLDARAIDELLEMRMNLCIAGLKELNTRFGP